MTRTVIFLAMVIIISLAANTNHADAQAGDCSTVLNQAGVSLAQAAIAASNGDAVAARELIEQVRASVRPCVSQNFCPALANLDTLLSQAGVTQDSNQSLEFTNAARLLLWACLGTGNSGAGVVAVIAPTVTPIPLPTPTPTVMPTGDAMSRPACTLTATTATNVRAQPNVLGAVVGQVQANANLPAIAQFQDREGGLWWLLQADGWVQGETVNTAGACDDLPPPPLAVPDNRQQIPNSQLMTGGIGQTNGAPMPSGEFQVEWYCTDRNLNISTNEVDWYCTDTNGNVVERLSAEDFDHICQQTYNTPYTYAIQERTPGRPLAFSWRCYAAN